MSARRPFRPSVALLCVGALAAGGLTTATAAAAAPVARVAPARDGAARGGNVLIQLRDQHTNLDLRRDGARRTALAHADQRDLVASIERAGGTHVRQLVAPNAVAAHVSRAEVARLQRDTAVAQIAVDPTISVPQASAAAAATAAPPAHHPAKTCPFNPAGPGKPLQEPEAAADIHASNGNPYAPHMGNSIATGQGVIIANDGMNELAGNPNFQRPDGSHVVIDAPDYTADRSNDEDYGDASSMAAQGTVVYNYAGALPYSNVPSNCTFVIKGDAPGASLVDLSDVDTPIFTLSQQLAGVDKAVSTEHADVISESFGTDSLPGNAEAQMLAQANEAAVAAGVTVVESSGDSGDSGTVISAADDPAVIAAGAVDNFRLVAIAHDYRSYVSNNMAALSSGGTPPTNKLVDLLAPGYFGGEAACAKGSGGCPPDYPTESMRGTSESAPLIAGAAADVIQAYRQTHGGASPTPMTIKQVLTSTATDLHAPADQQGAGLLDVYNAVRAAQRLPGGSGAGSAGLVASPSQLDLAGAGGSTSARTVRLYNAGNRAEHVRGTYRSIGAPRRIGPVVTEHVSAPDPSKPIPPEGARAARPITFTVPRGLDRLDVDMIWPDATNGNQIAYALFDPRGRLAQLSYDDGVTTRHSIPNIQHATVTEPQAGNWTAKILWTGKDVDLALPPATPGSYTGPLSFKVSGQNFVDHRAIRSVTVPAHSSVRVPLDVTFPNTPGDHPESVQFTDSRGGGAVSIPIARRTRIPSGGGTFDTSITSTVGREIGQLNTYEVRVRSGRPSLTARFHVADTSADNGYTFYLVGPSGAVVSKATTPAASGDPGTATVTAPDPAAGVWQIDVELNLTVSGKEFTQTVHGQLLAPKAT